MHVTPGHQTFHPCTLSFHLLHPSSPDPSRLAHGIIITKKTAKGGSKVHHVQSHTMIPGQFEANGLVKTAPVYHQNDSVCVEYNTLILTYSK